MFKKLARKIVEEEIDSIRAEARTYRNALDEETDKRITDNNKYLKEMKKWLETQKSLEETINKLKNENEILKKYYRLDDEPTDEERIKMRIELKIHELEMENLSLRLQQANVTTIAFGLAQSMQTQLSHSLSPYVIHQRPY